MPAPAALYVRVTFARIPDSVSAAEVAVTKVIEGVLSVQISISTRHGRISDETHARIVEKIGKLERLSERLQTAEVTIDLERRDLPSVDLRVTAKQVFVAASQKPELLAAVDEAVEKVEQQLRKHKDKLQERHRASPHRP